VISILWGCSALPKYSAYFSHVLAVCTAIENVNLMSDFFCLVLLATSLPSLDLRRIRGVLLWRRTRGARRAGRRSHKTPHPYPLPLAFRFGASGWWVECAWDVTRGFVKYCYAVDVVFVIS
jgi:hypothetical protein